MGQAFLMGQSGGGGVTPIGVEIPIKCAIGADVKKGNFLGTQKRFDIIGSGSSTDQWYHIARSLNMLLLCQLTGSGSSSTGVITIDAYDLSTFTLLWSSTVSGRDSSFCESRNLLCCAGGRNKSGDYTYYNIYTVTRSGVTVKYSGNDGKGGDGQYTAVCSSENYMIFGCNYSSAFFATVNLATGTKVVSEPGFMPGHCKIAYVGNNMFICVGGYTSQRAVRLIKVGTDGKVTLVAATAVNDNYHGYQGALWVPKSGMCICVTNNLNFIKIAYTSSSISATLVEEWDYSLQPRYMHAADANYINFPEVERLICRVGLSTNSVFYIDTDGNLGALQAGANALNLYGIGVDILPVFMEYYNSSQYVPFLDTGYTGRYILGNSAIIATKDCAFDSDGVAISGL